MYPPGYKAVNRPLTVNYSQTATALFKETKK